MKPSFLIVLIILGLTFPALVVSASTAKIRCVNPSAEYSVSILTLDERRGTVTEKWQADGYSETNSAVFTEETVEWQSTTDAAAGTPGIVNDHRLDRFTGTYSSALEVGKVRLVHEVECSCQAFRRDAVPNRLCFFLRPKGGLLWQGSLSQVPGRYTS